MYNSRLRAPTSYKVPTAVAGFACAHGVGLLLRPRGATRFSQAPEASLPFAPGGSYYERQRATRFLGTRSKSLISLTGEVIITSRRRVTMFSGTRSKSLISPTGEVIIAEGNKVLRVEVL